MGGRRPGAIGRPVECPVERVDVLLDFLDAQLESLEFGEHDASLDERARTILMGRLEFGRETIAVCL